MDRDKLHEEINKKMVWVDNAVGMPATTWNKISEYIYDLEKQVEILKKDKGTADALRAYIARLEEALGDTTGRMEELKAEPSIHIENIYVTVNHFNDEQIYDEADQVEEE